MADSQFAHIDLSGLVPADLADQPAPDLRWVRLEDLVIDRAYQREITASGRRAIQKMANAFDWTRFGALQLAPLPGGTYAVVDGQHRAHAAALVGLAQVPGLIVPMTARAQALGFAAINRDRIRVDALSVFRAELAAGTEWAVECRDVVAAAGCTLMTANWSHKTKRGGQVFALRLVRTMVANGEADAVIAGLSAIRASTQGAQPWCYGGQVLSVWLPALATNQRFLRLDLPRVFDGIDMEGVLDGARATARRMGTSAKAVAIAEVVDILRAHAREAAA